MLVFLTSSLAFFVLQGAHTLAFLASAVAFLMLQGAHTLAFLALAIAFGVAGGDIRDNAYEFRGRSMWPFCHLRAANKPAAKSASPASSFSKTVW
jgi:hypothetical protein